MTVEPNVVPDWRRRIERLADAIEQKIALSPEWRRVFCSVPRHVLVPEFLESKGDRWSPVTHEGRDPQTWLEAVYSDQTLVIAAGDVVLAGGGTFQNILTSSSTQPSLMLRMLERLELRDGMRVLEIGTGSGYNAALLSERLGDANVVSIDVADELVSSARARLAALGYHPTLVLGDGYGGMPGRAPFDRIIATCSVRHIPPAWIEQLAPGGMIYVDVEGPLYAGNVIRLRVDAEKTRLVGRFDPAWAGFMPLRSPASLPPGSSAPRVPEARLSVERETSAPPQLLWGRDDTPFLFLLQLALPPGTRLTYGELERGRSYIELTTPDGACSRAHWSTGDPGPYRVQETPDASLWDLVEETYRVWRERARPAWPDLGLTVDATGACVVTYDSMPWPLPVPR
jgi:protein-L-isoaspartate O-methyltransferase